MFTLLLCWVLTAGYGEISQFGGFLRQIGPRQSITLGLVNNTLWLSREWEAEFFFPCWLHNFFLSIQKLLLVSYSNPFSRHDAYSFLFQHYKDGEEIGEEEKSHVTNSAWCSVKMADNSPKPPTQASMFLRLLEFLLSFSSHFSSRPFFLHFLFPRASLCWYQHCL
jgi:hypothetical protein